MELICNLCFRECNVAAYIMYDLYDTWCRQLKKFEHHAWGISFFATLSIWCVCVKNEEKKMTYLHRFQFLFLSSYGGSLAKNKNTKRWFITVFRFLFFTPIRNGLTAHHFQKLWMLYGFQSVCSKKNEKIWFDKKFFEETDQDFRNPWIYSLTSNGLLMIQLA
jgi:hypothetical protein